MLHVRLALVPAGIGDPGVAGGEALHSIGEKLGELLRRQRCRRVDGLPVPLAMFDCFVSFRTSVQATFCALAAFAINNTANIVENNIL